jgi:FG-GAP-like repeat
MIRDWRTHTCVLFLTGVAGLIWLPVPRVLGYVEASHSLGQVVSLSTNIVLMKVTAIDRKDNRIIYAKVRDIKGVHKQQEIRHNIAQKGFEPREWQNVMNWADIGKEALFFHNGGQSETCIGMYWYQCDGNANDPNGWWGMTHGEPFLLRSFAGRLDKLVSAAADIHAGKEVIVPCMVDGNKDDLKSGKAKIQRLRASLKLANYDSKRDFVGWGGEDFRRLSGMPGFTHISSLPRVDPDAQSISTLDFNNDGKPDICLAGAGRVALLNNTGESLGETSLPGQTGCRAAVWADYNGDGLPDLLLATPTGPKLFTNLGKGEFRDDSHLLPREPGYNLTCAAWIDQDGDGRPDILLGNGWHGLRLYRNKGKSDHKQATHLDDWHYIGPFSNEGGKGFDTVYPPEKGIDLTKKVAGMGGEVAWKTGNFNDGKVNNLALFEKKEHAVVYLFREITCKAATKLPISLGSDDGLAVWINGKKVVSVNTNRSCVPDSNKVTLDLKAGKNELLLKVTQVTGPWEFYFKEQGNLPPAITWAFEDVSDAVGLGEKGIGSAEKGDSLAVGDLDGDGKQDFIYGAGTGVVVRNAGSKFVEVKDSGITFETGRVGPVLGDYNADGRPDLFVPQKDGCKLFKNMGQFKFVDVTAEAGLDKVLGRVTCAAWGDVDNDGKVDLVIGRLRATNLYLRNKGDGTFEDASAKLGLEQRVFNTQAICLVDLNNDGVLDMVFNNEGQESTVLLGNPEVMAKRTPVSLQLAGQLGVTGSRVKVTDSKGTLCGTHNVSGGEGRGGQSWPVARFALEPGTYRVEVLFSGGERRARELVVATNHVRGVLDEKTPQAER